ncbi:MAG: pentapeptide repeat-containing protein [Kofleriaceae bacterium]
MTHATHSTAELLAGFQEQIDAAHRRTSRLAAALDRYDNAQAVAATELLCRALISAEQLASLLACKDADAHQFAKEKLRATLRGAVPRLVLASRSMKEVEDVLLRFHNLPDEATTDPRRNAVLREDDARWASGQLSGTRLRALRARGWRLRGVHLTRTHLENCDFGASALLDADFDASRVESCDFGRANLSSSSWSTARASRTSFAGAMMTDTRIDHMTFADCDLRGADFSVVNRGGLATATGALFLRCDLRETNWNARWLSSVRFVDCKLHGTFGRPVVGMIDIQRADLSPEGNGSRPASAGDVLRSWGQ